MLNFAKFKRSIALDLFSFGQWEPVLEWKEDSNVGDIIVIASSSMESDSKPFLRYFAISLSSTYFSSRKYCDFCFVDKTIGGAYRTATQISDETKKADALMGLMRTIDNA